ncbi:MAG: hypothetical protein QOI54_2545 [Actinomycetota bacterium]|jgi:hypothetical protein|nr:hypothetical protein [Actinomycetota bacterium]
MRNVKSVARAGSSAAALTATGQVGAGGPLLSALVTTGVSVDRPHSVSSSTVAPASTSSADNTAKVCWFCLFVRLCDRLDRCTPFE